MGMAARKERRTFTLDPELVGYVEEIRKQYKKESASSALEEILRESKRRREQQRIEDSIARYYSSLTDEEVRRDRNWGAFAESQFPED